MSFKIQKFEIIEIVFFVALVVIVFVSWNNSNVQQPKSDNIKSVTENSADLDEVMTAEEIAQFKKTYGWTPSFGYTQDQLLNFMKDNPDATPAELEAGTKEALLQGGGATQTFKMPLCYFPSDNIGWGSVDTSKDMDDTSTWKRATIIGGDVFQSFPTTNITIDGFSNEIKSLPPATPTEWDVGQEYYEEQKKEYGDLAVRFWSGEYRTGEYGTGAYSITFLKKFDVDRDGQNETMIGICGLWGNHCPHEILIIKNNKQIFQFGDEGPGIISSETGNGFYLTWHAAKHYEGVGLCCPKGHIKTRFVFENNKFVPIYEQEILYFEVENTE